MWQIVLPLIKMFLDSVPFCKEFFLFPLVSQPRDQTLAAKPSDTCASAALWYPQPAHPNKAFLAGNTPTTGPATLQPIHITWHSLREGRESQLAGKQHSDWVGWMEFKRIRGDLATGNTADEKMDAASV